MKRRVRTAVLISGAGTNMQALVRAAEAEDYPAEIALVVSNRPDAAGLERAREMGVEAVAIDHKSFPTREEFERELDAKLKTAGVELVALAGFMRILTPWFVRQWEGRLVNIHPSLLPRHKGLHTHRRVLEAGDARHGASVHWVSEELDGGDVIAQVGFDVDHELAKLPEAEAALAARVRDIEHSLYPEALAQAARTVVRKRGVQHTPR